MYYLKHNPSGVLMGILICVCVCIFVYIKTYMYVYTYMHIYLHFCNSDSYKYMRLNNGILVIQPAYIYLITRTGLPRYLDIATILKDSNNVVLVLNELRIFMNFVANPFFSCCVFHRENGEPLRGLLLLLTF